MAYQRTLEPKLKEVAFPGGQPWGGLNRYEKFSRYTIPDTDFDDLVNAIPMGGSVPQIPNNGAPFTTLVSQIIWMVEYQLNAGFFLFCLCQNGHLYQVSVLSGTITDASGATSLGPKCDITLWQETVVIVSDPDVHKTYSWNGTTFAEIVALNAVKGSFITVYSGRLWLSSGNVVVFTQGGTYNSLGGDSGSFLIIDSDCITPIQAIYPFNGLLYVFGQDWCQVIGNLFSSGSPAQLLFNKYTIEVQVGLSSKWSLITFASTLFFANPNGIWNFTGTIPSKVSAPTDSFFDSQASDSTLSAAFCEIYSEPCLMWCLHLADGYGALVYSITNGKWFRFNLGMLKFVADGTINNVATTWGTDGTNIFTLFTDFTTPLTSTFGFKYWSFGSPVQYLRVTKMGLATMIITSVTATLSVNNESGVQVALPLGNQTQTVIPTLVFLGKDNHPITWTN